MDTRDLTDALREATDGIEPRAGFAEDVLRGGRRRRTRGRIMIGAAMATAAVAVAAAVAVPMRLAEPRPAAPPTTEPQGHPLLTSSGELIDDTQFVQLAATTWRQSLPGTPANTGGVLNQPLIDPHVTWAGYLPNGRAAIVAQQFAEPKTGRPLIAVGLLTEDAEGALHLIGVQIEGHWARPGSFVLPDNRTVIAVDYASPPASRVFNISSNITVGADGVSRREWTQPLGNHWGVWIGLLPANVNPRNVRMLDSKPGLDPNDAEEQVMGLHRPLLFTSEYLSGTSTAIPNRGLPWAPDVVALGEDTHTGDYAAFQVAVRDSGLLDPTSYTDNSPRWTAVVGLHDGRTALISTHQELDNPAYVFEVVLNPDGSVDTVTRVAKLDLATPLSVRLPGDEGWVVAVDPGKQFRYRADGDWSTPVDGAGLVPADATAIETGGQEFELT